MPTTAPTPPPRAPVDRGAQPPHHASPAPPQVGTISGYRDRASSEALVVVMMRSVVAVRVSGRWDGGVQHDGDGACGRVLV